MKNVLRFLLALAIAMALMLAIRSYALTVCTVTGTGLSPHLQPGDRVLVDRTAPHQFRKGDIVVFGPDKTIGYVKAALGDTISIGKHQFTLTSHCMPQCNCQACHFYLISTGRQLFTVSAADIIGKAYRIYPFER